jgi:PDZ domain/PEGA domain
LGVGSWKLGIDVGAVLLGVLVLCAPTGLAQQTEPPELTQARQYFEALDYEQAMPLLDRAIGTLEPQAARDQAVATQLVSAYQMRARARFGTGNRDGAMTDFKAALAIEPGFTLGEGVSPRIVALLDEVKAATLGAVELTLDPATADLTVDGIRRRLQGTRLALTGGSHAITVGRPGYKPVEQSIVVNVGETVPLTIRLERVSSVVSIITTPPGAEVVINATPRGKTMPGPLPPGLEEVPQRLGVPASQVSQPLILSDLTTGTFDVEFRRECYVPQHRTLEIDALRDIAVEPVKLEPAVGTLVAESEPPGVTVSVDSEARGTSPLTLEGICAGPHVIEFKGPGGRAVQRVTVETGQRVEAHGRVRPAFALIAAPAAAGGTLDPRLAVERALADADQLLLYAPPADVVEDVLTREPVSDEWFGVTETQTTAPTANRRERLVRLADAFDAQGVAWVHAVRPGASEVQIALAAPGGAEPDVLTVVLDQPDSVKQALDRLTAPLLLFRGSAGMVPIDVLDVKGIVVGDVEGDGPAAGAGIKPGDIIDNIDGHAIESVKDFEAQLAGHTAGRITLSVKTGAAAAREVAVPIRRVPVLQTGSDRFLPANAVVAVLRSRLSAATDPAEQAILRLNLAAALLQAGAPADARTLLEQVSLPPGPGVSKGTVQYLTGEAALALGDKAAAAQAFEAARQAGGRLADDGPAVESLAGRALERLK